MHAMNLQDAAALFDACRESHHECPDTTFKTCTPVGLKTHQEYCRLACRYFVDRLHLSPDGVQALVGLLDQHGVWEGRAFALMMLQYTHRQHLLMQVRALTASDRLPRMHPASARHGRHPLRFLSARLHQTKGGRLCW